MFCVVSMVALLLIIGWFIGGQVWHYYVVLLHQFVPLIIGWFIGAQVWPRLGLTPESWGRSGLTRWWGCRPKGGV